MKRALDEEIVPFASRLRAILTDARDALIHQIAGVLPVLTPDGVTAIEVDTADLGEAIESLMLFFFHRGYGIGKRELSHARTFAGFTPDDAMRAIESRAILIRGLINDDIKNAVRLALYRHLELGRPASETIDRLREIFDPYVGDPSKIEPGNESLLSAPRLEAIIRSESNAAMNAGRVAVANDSNGYTIGFAISAILDSRTSEQCKFADGLSFRIDDPRAGKLTPPLHFGACRSVLTFITRDDLPVTFSTDQQLDNLIGLIPPEFK